MTKQVPGLHQASDVSFRSLVLVAGTAAHSRCPHGCRARRRRTDYSIRIALAHAVTASAAYPLLLPALDESLPFDRRDGSRLAERVILTGGGVYDNLGLAPLWPGRDTSVSLNVRPVDTIICCRAGYGLRQDPPTQFFWRAAHEGIDRRTRAGADSPARGRCLAQKATPLVQSSIN